MSHTVEILWGVVALLVCLELYMARNDREP